MASSLSQTYMDRVLESRTETKNFRVRIKTTHAPEPTAEEFDLDEAKTSRPHMRLEHVAAYPMYSEKDNNHNDEEEQDNERSHLRQFASSYRHLNHTGLSSDVYPIALYINECDEVRFFDIVGEIASGEVASQLPQNGDDVRTGFKPTWNTEMQVKGRIRKADILYRLPHHRLLVPLTGFVSTWDCMKALYDSIEAHEALTNSGEVHGNINLNTILTDEHRPGDPPRSQSGYLFDWEHPRTYAVPLPGLEGVNWRAMVGSLPAMRNYMPALVEQIRGMKFQEESDGAEKTG